MSSGKKSVSSDEKISAFKVKFEVPTIGVLHYKKGTSNRGRRGLPRDSGDAKTEDKKCVLTVVIVTNYDVRSSHNDSSDKTLTT